MLTQAVGEALGREFLDLEIDVDATDGRLLAFLAAKGEVVSQVCNDTIITVRVRMPSGAMGQVHSSALAIRPADSDLFSSNLISSDMATETTASPQAEFTSAGQKPVSSPVASLSANPTTAKQKLSDNHHNEPSDGVSVSDNPASDNPTEVV